MRSQREPGHANAAADRDRQTGARSAHKGHQRGSVYRPRHHRAGHPDPAATVVGPAAVVEGREAPGSIVHPRPAPRLHPRPVPIAVRRPTGIHARRPDPTVIGHFAPRAVGIHTDVAGVSEPLPAGGQDRIIVRSIDADLHFEIGKLHLRAQLDVRAGLREGEHRQHAAEADRRATGLHSEDGERVDPRRLRGAGEKRGFHGADEGQRSRFAVPAAELRSDVRPAEVPAAQRQEERRSDARGLPAKGLSLSQRARDIVADDRFPVS